MLKNIPAWCRWRAGGSHLLLIAPHGGARDAARSGRPRKVNDLHTAEFADELAVATDAGLIANPSLDRNHLDLNRISQLVRGAPWFLALLEHLLADILARHAHAEVLFLHGWNTLQAKCDIGIGRRLDDAASAAAHAQELTASPAYISSRLDALRAACAAAGVLAPFGERYPARHPNNAVQLFRRGGHAAASPRLAAWIASGRVDAVQLELGVPLRWPGATRRAFMALLGRSFTAPTIRGPLSHQTVAASSAPLALSLPHALQAYDAGRQLGLTGRIDTRAGGAGVAGRLLLFIGDRQVALFTGEDPHVATLSGGGPHFTAHEAGCLLTFDGALLLTDDGTRYLDLEQAFAASRLVIAHADLAFTPGATVDYGRVHGTVVLDDIAYAIDTLGFARPATPVRAADNDWQSQLTLHAAFSPTVGFRLRHQVPGNSELEWLGATPRALSALQVCFDGDPPTPRTMCVDDGSTTLNVLPLGRVVVLRPLGRGRLARVTFGTARFAHGDAVGYGFYEHARALSE
ncbi:MAG: hypothetical protein ABI629_12280 [bacterium]